MTTVRFQHHWYLGQIVVWLTDDGWNEWQTGGLPELRNLCEQYNVIEYDESLGAPYLFVSLGERLNPIALSQTFNSTSLPGVLLVEPYSSMGDSHDIEVLDVGEEYLFRFGMGRLPLWMHL